MSKFTRWFVVILAVVAMVAVIGIPDADASQDRQKQDRKQERRQAKGPGGNGGGGGGGGGKPGGGDDPDGNAFPRIFGVTIIAGTGIAVPGPCNNNDPLFENDPTGHCDNKATIDEDAGARENTSKKLPSGSGPYNTGARLYELNDINVQGLVLSDTSVPPGALSCSAFMSEHAPDSWTAGALTNFMQASISLDLTAAEGKYDRRAADPGPTWTETGPRGVKGRITAPNLNWNLRFDSEWRNENYSYAGGADDGTLVVTGTEPVTGTEAVRNTEWVFGIGDVQNPGTVLAQEYGNDGSWALCNVTLSWTIKRN